LSHNELTLRRTEITDRRRSSRAIRGDVYQGIKS